MATKQIELSLYEPFSLRASWQVWHRVQVGRVDLIVVWLSPYAPWYFSELKATRC
jgi:hypothetical protein